MMGKAFQAEGTANARAGMNSAEQSIHENASGQSRVNKGRKCQKQDLRGEQGLFT